MDGRQRASTTRDGATKKMKANSRAGMRVGTAALACGVSLFGAFAGGNAWASPKEECMEAHGRAQDFREAGHLTSARQAFLSCAQTSCPALIQADCARLGEELERLVPSVSFAARDPSGLDIPDTAVYVDDQPVASRLDEGKSYDLDPGKHAVRFVHDGHESTVTVVLTQGDKTRSVVAVFGDPAMAATAPPTLSPPGAQAKRPVAPLLVAGLGAAATATGAVLVVLGLRQVPSECSLGTRQCVTAPGDPTLGQAHQGVTLANVGLGVGIGGAALLAAGTFWYFAQPLQSPKETASVAPWVGDRAAGVTVHTRF